TGSMRSPLLDQLLADGTRPVLLARAPRPLDLETYHARLLTQPAATWTAEQWFVENTYQRDEFANLAKWLQARADRQAHISVVLPTRNDAGRIVSLLTGMRRALQVDPPEPIADEILVVDAGSQDDTASLAAGQGVPVLRLAPPAGARSLLVGPAAVLGGALNLAMGDILVWLDPQAGRVHPSYVALLAGPLLHDPQVLLVKPFWATDARGAAEIEAPGGLADARFSAISVDDLLAWPIPRLATLPLHSWLRAFYPRLGAVMQPLGRLFAARISLLRELLPALDAYEAAARAERDRTPAFSPNTAFFAGMLLETATRHSTRAIAQVEMQTRPRGHSRQSVVNPDVRQLRQVAELLAFFAARPDSVPRQAAIEQLRHRILTSSS
ncbi:MAG TPA: hypothetical protein VKY74_11365, partial [Chloroflexia bacterium]|nr:hypothetical protein [Chloroflexia bacterium]